MQGSDFRAIREALGLSQSRLGEVLGVRYETIGKIERGGEVDPRTRYAMLYLAEHPVEAMTQEQKEILLLRLAALT